MTDSEKLHVLWKKWAYNDSLMYTRERTFWVIQGVVFGILFVSYGSLTSKNITEFIWLLTVASSLTAGGLLGLAILKMIYADRDCRNLFNREIVRILLDNNLVDKGPKDVPPEKKDEFYEGWLKDDWRAHLDWHPMNKWQTPTPFEKNSKGRASKWVKIVISAGSIIELGIALFVILLLTLLLTDPFQYVPI